MTTFRTNLDFSSDRVLAAIDWESCKDSIPTTYDFVDFFSGCGGMSYGFHTIGKSTQALRGVGAFDIDPHANTSYERNFDIRPSDLNLADATGDEIRAVMTKNRRDMSNPLIVIGCAPCQGFSSHRKKDPRKDERNSLVARFADIAVDLEPEVIIMENVPDLLTHKHWHHYDAFRQTLEAAGYNITASVVNMATYGVPQKRFRTIVIAAKSFIPTIPPALFDASTFKTVRDAIGELPPLDSHGGSWPDDPMHVTSKHRKATVEILRQVPKNGGSRPSGVGPNCLDKVAGFYDVYGRLPWDKPSITITARCRTPSCGRFAHPEQDRGLSVREAALLQGFPPDFVFEGPFDDKFKQVGNAVPPIFSTYLAAHVLSMLAGRNRAHEPQGIREPQYRSYSSLIAHLDKPDNP